METVRCGIGRDLPAVKEIWAECFGDDRFAEWFFARLYRQEYLRVLECGGEIVSMAFCFPREMVVPHATLNTWYLYGIGTRKSARGKGFAKRLIAACAQEAQSCGVDLCFLIPAEQSLFSYYQSCGFSTVWKRREETGVVRATASDLVIRPVCDDFTQFNQIYETMFPMRIKRTQHDWHLISEEFQMGSGAFYLLYRGEKQVGYCGMLKEQDVLHIRELGLTTEDTAEAVCDELGFLTNSKTWCHTFPGNGTPFAAGMMLKQGICMDRFEVNCDLMYN